MLPVGQLDPPVESVIEAPVGQLDLLVELANEAGCCRLGS